MTPLERINAGNRIYLELCERTQNDQLKWIAVPPVWKVFTGSDIIFVANSENGALTVYSSQGQFECFPLGTFLHKMLAEKFPLHEKSDIVVEKALTWLQL